MNKLELREIDNMFYYDKDDLGYTFKENRHWFKAWSPLANDITLCIYPKYNEDKKLEYSMIKNKIGVWEISLDTDLEGKYYTFVVTVNNNISEVVDPYAKALSVNGEKGAIINMEKTNPENWSSYNRKKIKDNTDAIIYEVNIRDISIDKNSGIKNKGKYLGLSERETTGPNGTKTGLNHIKDLGVTHIQLLPIYDFGSIDESIVNSEDQFENSISYNWGYDPAYYNVPEGSYSTNPLNPSSRIKELKIAIKAIHDSGLSVIMDVVYNHMYDAEKSGFEKLMPGYYFRYDENCNLANESMCGNAIASENAMVRKYIVDSVIYWAKEYKIDGFRFDLMGLIDVDTMNSVKKELNNIDPSIIVLGEGWNMGNVLNNDMKSIQSNAYKLKNIAFFNDSIRDGLRGSTFFRYAKGFLNGENNKEIEVKKAVVGGIRYSYEIQTWGEVEPNQVVNYIECHDNHTLFDKLKLTVVDDRKIRDMHRLGTSIVLLAQGIPFIHAGQEFLRTKQGVENSYSANDSINKLDWSRKQENMDTVEYVKGLIKLRKSHPAFRMYSSDDIRKNLEFIDVQQNCIAYTIKNNANYDTFKNIIVVHNANEMGVEVYLRNYGEWNVIVDKNDAGIEVIKTVNGDKIFVDGLSTLVAVQE